MDDPILPQQTFSGIAGGGELSLYQYFTSSPLFAGFKDFNSPERRLFLSEYSGMPSTLKNFLASTETATSIATLGLSYELDDNQISKVAGTLRELVLGKIFIKDFPVTLSSKLGIDDVKAGEIVNKIVSQSFGPIIEDLKRIQRGKFPDKVMAMQKETQPAGLSPKPQVPENIKNMPLTQPGARQDVQSVRPPPVPVAAQPTPPPAGPVSPLPILSPAKPELQNRGSSIVTQNQKDSGTIGTVDFSQVRQAQDKPVQSPPPVQASPPPAPPQSAPIVTPEPKLPPRPEFKMPDLGPFDPGKSGGVVQAPVKSTVNPPPKPDQGQAAQKSLEDELLKVANVIDLRAKSGE